MGRTYSIRTEDAPERVKAAAQLLQEHVDELRRLGTTVASDRLLALAALNLAGKLLQKEEEQAREMGALLSELDDVVLQAQSLAEAPLR